MLAIMPQKISGCSFISSGPGWTPWITNAPSIRAVTPLMGIPSVSSGIIEPAVAALLAVSGPATPSITLAEPFRMFGHLLLDRVRYERGGHGAAARQNPEEEAEHCPADRQAELSQSFRVGSSPLIFVAMTSRADSSSTFRSTSEIPKSPMTTGMIPMPSSARRSRR